MSEAQMPGRRIGPVVLDLKNISLSFGGEGTDRHLVQHS